MSSVVVVSSENLDEKQQSVSTSVVQTTDKKVNLLGMSRAELEQFFEKIGEKKFRAGQVMKWIHQYFVTDFAEMSNISGKLREKLETLGAEVLEKSTDLKVIGTAVEPPPQPASDRPASAELSGSKGAPASTWSKERRETLVIFDMLNKGCVGLQIESHNIFVSVVSGESTWCRHSVSSL